MVYVWLAKYRQGGLDALRAKPVPGRPPKLSDAQLGRLYRLAVGNDPRQLRFASALWTRAMVRGLVHREFGVRLSEPSVGRLLRKLGLSPQRPLYRAWQQDPEAVARWKREEYPQIRAQAAKVGAAIWFAAYDGNLNALVFLDFCRRLLHDTSGPVFLVLDGHPVHRSGAVKAFAASTNGRLRLCFLPGYAPELNPMSGCGSTSSTIGSAVRMSMAPMISRPRRWPDCTGCKSSRIWSRASSGIQTFITSPPERPPTYIRLNMMACCAR